MAFTPSYFHPGVTPLMWKSLFFLHTKTFYGLYRSPVDFDLKSRTFIFHSTLPRIFAWILVEFIILFVCFIPCILVAYWAVFVAQLPFFPPFFCIFISMILALGVAEELFFVTCGNEIVSVFTQLQQLEKLLITGTLLNTFSGTF